MSMFGDISATGALAALAVRVVKCKNTKQYDTASLQRVHETTCNWIIGYIKDEAAEYYGKEEVEEVITEVESAGKISDSAPPKELVLYREEIEEIEEMLTGVNVAEVLNGVKLSTPERVAILCTRQNKSESKINEIDEILTESVNVAEVLNGKRLSTVERVKLLISECI